MNNLSFIKRLYPFAKDYRSSLIIINVLSQLANLIFISYFFILKNIIDGGILKKDPAIVLRDLALLVFIAVFREAFRYFLNWHRNVIEEKMDRDVQSRVFSHVLKLPQKTAGAIKTGNLINKVMSESSCITYIVTGAAIEVVRQPITAAVLLGLLFYYDPLMGFIVTCFILPAAFAGRWISGKLDKYYEIYYEKKAQIMSRVQEVFGMFDVIKAFSRESAEGAGFTGMVDSLIKNDLKLTRLSLLNTPIGEVIKVFALAAIVLVGSYRIKAGMITAGTFIVFVAAVVSLFSNLSSMLNLYAGLVSSVSGAKRVFRLLDESQEDPGVAEGKTGDCMKGDICLKDVSFSYAACNPVLIGIDLVISPGDFVVVIGASGCGKTTLCKLLLRFYEPDAGLITAGGKDMLCVDLKSWRRGVAAAFQEPAVFNDSAVNNIVLARETGGTEEIRKSAVLADIDSEIMSLENGYDTVIGNRGLRLSSGQKQRLTIARAILNEPELLILDDATSFIGDDSEGRILRGLRDKRRQKKTLLLSNRPAAADYGNKIYELNDGHLRLRAGAKGAAV